MATREQPLLTNHPKRRLLVVHQLLMLVLIIGMLLQSVPTASAQDDRVPFTPPGAYDPEPETFGIMSNQYTDALDIDPMLDPWISFNGSDPNGYGVFSTHASDFPTKGNTYLAISSGCTSQALTANTHPNTSCYLNGLDTPQGYDMVQMRLTVNVPPWAQSWRVHWKFFSEEYPEWVSSPYNDAFLLEQDISNFTINGPYNGITAPNNKAFDQQGNPITINTTGQTQMSPGQAFGTTYDGATGALRTCEDIAPGTTNLTLIFSIMDLGDPIYDSTAFIDQFDFINGPACVPRTGLAEICGNNIDDDKDGLTDEGCVEICGNGVDDNLDGRIDEGCNTAPTVNAGGPYTGTEGSSIALYGTANDADTGDTLSPSWSYTPVAGVDPGTSCSFGNAQSLNSTFTCNDDGTYQVTLTVSDGVHAEVSSTATVTVSNVAPTASFIAPSQITEGSSIALALTSPTDPSSNDRNAGFSYAFDCGSGYGPASSTATASCPTTDNGTRTVKARIIDKDGASSEYVRSVQVINAAPTASFTASTPVNEGDPIQLTLSSLSDPSSADQAAGFRYAFDCGAGFGPLGSTTTVACPTNDNGIRTVKARIIDKDGGMTEYTSSSTVRNVAPSATFTSASHVNEGSPIALALTNPTDPSSVDRAAGFSYAFDCGTGYGSVSSAANAACPTTDNGTRTVKARITDKDGASTEYTATSTIANVAPTATFSATSPVTEGSPIALALIGPFDPSSVDTGAGFRYAFDCGAGFSPLGSTPTASCPTTDNGTRTVKARISDKDGSTTEYVASVQIINAAPTASFTASTPVNEGDSIALALIGPFDPSSVDTSAGFRYAFDCGTGFGPLSGTPTASCATTDNGTRTVKARISDKDGGTTEYVAQVTVENVVPTASFTAPSRVDEGDLISLTLSDPTDPSSVDTAAGFSYAFDCGAGYGTATPIAATTCTTDDNGTRTVKARIIDKDGGATEYVAHVAVRNVAPTATFTTTAPVDEGSPFTLTLSSPSDPSSVDRAAGFSYAFDCGTGYAAASSTATVSCATTDNGTRTVKARITDKDGGTTEYTATSTIDNVAPTASFTASSHVDEGQPIQLKLTDPVDPSDDDTTTGFSYDFDCGSGSGYGAASATTTASCSTNDNGTRTVKARITDKDGGATEYTATSTIANVAPIATFTVMSPVDEGSPFILTLSDASDPSSVDTAAGFSYAFDCGTAYGAASSTATATCLTNDDGTRTVKARITDKDGGVTEYVGGVTITNVAPTATFTASTPVNEGDPILLALSDASDPSSVDTAAGFSYDFDCGTGSGYSTPSSTATASCATTDNGTRTVKARITDKDGGVTEYVGDITMLNVAPTVGPIIAPTAPVALGTMISIGATFSDPGTADTHTATIDWGDGTTSAGTVAYRAGSSVASVQASHTYTAPGVYTVKLTVTDDDGGAGTSIFQYVVIYNSNGGAVNGQGKINSPAGAYVADPSLTGQAHFGFQSNYQKGTTIPDGKTNFDFKTAGLDFRSTTYEWLVVAGPKAQFKGSGTINSTGNYGFIVTAIDGDINGGGGTDKFRIKIWDKNNGDAVVYDNQLGATADADPATVLQQGMINIQQDKLSK